MIQQNSSQALRAEAQTSAWGPRPPAITHPAPGSIPIETPPPGKELAYWRPLAAVHCLFLLLGLLSIGKEPLTTGYNDFAPIYAGIKLVGTPNMYDAHQIPELITEQFGSTSAAWRYTRLPFHAVFLWPLGQLPYRSAYLAFVALQLAAVAAFAAMWRIPSGAHATAFTLLCMPAFFALLSGQDAVFLLLWIALAVRWEGRGSPFWAGIALSLCAIKFHLFMLLPLLLVGQRRWRMLAGVSTGGLGLLLISFVAAGFRWPLDYYTVLTDPSIHRAPHVMTNLQGLLHGFPRGGALEILCAALIVAVTWLVVRRTSFQAGLAVVLVGGLLVSYHAYQSDCVLLLPAALLLASRLQGHWTQLLGILLLTPPLYLSLYFGWAFLVPMVMVGFFCVTAVRLLRASPIQAV